MDTIVKKTTRTTKTLCMFPWGIGWRVKYTKTSNSHTNSKILAFHDEEYSSLVDAKRAYDEIKESM